ncbi:Imm49 family immunity protein [Citreicoccus inhibens]|uniref:Imm49 family immunity protein n=1 Tax=Citreicoccus inhibens TaxID=2849499 RepID=UPI001F16DECA|nr:Imm49 family immunity protein [Citreicoccus inhibens]
MSVFIDNALGDNEEKLAAFTAGQGGLKEALQFSQNFRIAGIGSLLMSGTATRFHECLHASARAFAYFLRSAPDSQKLTSRSAPFFDAVACEDIEAARELARHSPRCPDRAREYEEDFLFVRFLMDFFFQGMSVNEGLNLLEHYETILEGTQDIRLTVCRAFLASDSAGFDEALSNMMEERNMRVQKMRDQEAAAEESLSTEGYLSVEGVALVRLALSRGLTPSGHYLSVPTVACEPPLLRYREDVWRNMLA